MKRSRFLLGALAALAVSIPAHSQTEPGQNVKEQRTATEANKNERAAAPALIIGVVVAEFNGSTKVSSLPYSVHTLAWEPAGPHCPAAASMRYDVTVTLPGGRHSGVNMDIDYGACDRGGGEFDVPITISRTSVEPIPTSATDSGPLTPFFRANSTVVLRNGETAQAVSAVDPVTGHVLKVDVTLTVLK